MSRFRRSRRAVLIIPAPDSTFTRNLDHKLYELTDHLGNVRVVLSDIKESVINGTTNLPENFTARVEGYYNYYSFGAEMTGRVYTATSYRYNFQGQEKDPEIWGGAISYKYRIEDPRLGRFFSTDPLEKKFAYNSPYAFSENRVIDGFEVDGMWVITVQVAAELGLGLAGNEVSAGIAFGTDGVAFFVSDVSHLGPMLIIGASVGAYGFPTMSSVQNISGPSEGVSLSGAYLGKGSLGAVYSSGYLGGGGSLGIGLGARLSLDVGGTGTSRTYSWKEVASFLMQSSGGTDPDKVKAYAKSLFEKYKKVVELTLIKEISNKTRELNSVNSAIKSLQKDLDTNKNSTSFVVRENEDNSGSSITIINGNKDRNQKLDKIAALKGKAKKLEKDIENLRNQKDEVSKTEYKE